MISATFNFVKLMILALFLCIFVRVSITKPLLDNSEDPAKLHIPYFDGYHAARNELTNKDFHEISSPQRVHGDHQNKQFFYQYRHHSPDNVDLAKRIIMLPRVGRR